MRLASTRYWLALISIFLTLTCGEIFTDNHLNCGELCGRIPGTLPSYNAGILGAQAWHTHHSRHLIARLSGDEIFASDDDGESWVLLGNNRPFDGWVKVFATMGNTLFAAFGGSTGGVYRSEDGGTTWTFASSGLPIISGTSGFYDWIWDLEVVESLIYAAAQNHGIFVTNDRGDSWSQVYADQIDDSSILLDFGANRWVTVGFMSVYISDDQGITWRDFRAGLPSDESFGLRLNPTDVEVIDSTVYLGTEQVGMFVLKPGSQFWESHVEGMVVYSEGSGRITGVNDFAVVGNRIYAVGNTGAYYLENPDSSWIPLCALEAGNTAGYLGILPAEGHLITIDDCSPRILLP